MILDLRSQKKFTYGDCFLLVIFSCTFLLGLLRPLCEQFYALFLEKSFFCFEMSESYNLDWH